MLYCNTKKYSSGAIIITSKNAVTIYLLFIPAANSINIIADTNASAVP